MSNTEGCVTTPLVDLLRNVPITHRTEWEIQWAEDGTPTGHAMCPIGKHCHDAADRIESETARADGLQGRYDQCCKNYKELVELWKAETARADAAARDAAFYKCCALSGEIPTEGAQPSAKEDKP